MVGSGFGHISSRSSNEDSQLLHMRFQSSEVVLQTRVQTLGVELSPSVHCQQQCTAAAGGSPDEMESPWYAFQSLLFVYVVTRR
eukprot:4893440-Amphidinium_carterae.1